MGFGIELFTFEIIAAACHLSYQNRTVMPLPLLTLTCHLCMTTWSPRSSESSAAFAFAFVGRDDLSGCRMIQALSKTVGQSLP